MTSKRRPSTVNRDVHETREWSSVRTFKTAGWDGAYGEELRPRRVDEQVPLVGVRFGERAVGGEPRPEGELGAGAGVGQQLAAEGNRQVLALVVGEQIRLAGHWAGVLDVDDDDVPA